MEPQEMHGSMRLEHNLLAVEDEHTVNVMLELAAPDAPADEERPALKLALVLDRSGSMGGDKLEVTKACAAWLVQRLGPGDEVGIVIYDDAVDLLAPLAPVDADALVHALGHVFAGGTTNLSGGWLNGLELLRAADGNGDAHRRVVLLTDGLANVGVTAPGALVAMTREAAAAGVSTTTIGLGADFDETLLTGIADAGGGNAHYAETPDAAPAIFGEEFEGLTSVVAQNVSVEIRPVEEVEIISVLNDYPATPVPGGLQLALGDAYGGDRRTLVFQLHLPSVADLGEAKVADVVVRYVSVGDEVAMREMTMPLLVNVVPMDEAHAEQPDQRVTEEVLILKAARARDEARERAERGDFDGGAALLVGTAEELRVASLHDEAEALEEIAAEVDADRYHATTAKQLHYTSRNARRRRR